MKKFNFKSIAVGIVIGIIGVSAIFFVKSNIKVDNAPMAQGVKSATVNKEQNGLKDVQAAANTSNNGSNAETMERIQKGMEIKADASNNKTDAEAIETMKKTGNWSYIEKSLPSMTADGVEKVVEIYNSKHTNPSEYKKASDYRR